MSNSSSEDRSPASDGALAHAGSTAPPSAVSFRRIGWSVALSLLVLFVIGYFTFEPGEFGQLARRVNPWMLALALGTVALRVLAGGERLRYVSRGRLSLRGGIRGQLAWEFLSIVTPSAVGGGPLASFYIARDGEVQIGEATAILLFAMLLDQIWLALLIPVLLLSASFFQVFPASLGGIGTGAFVAIFTAMLVWVALFAYAVLYRIDLLERLVDWIFGLRWLRRFQERVEQEMSQLRRRARILRAQPPGFFVKGFGLTVVTWTTRFLIPLFIVWSVYPTIDDLLFLLRTAAMHLAAIILPTPGGAGGIEGLYVLFLGPLMPQALVAPTLLLWRLLAYYLFIALGVYLSMHQVQKTIRRR